MCLPLASRAWRIMLAIRACTTALMCTCACGLSPHSTVARQTLARCARSTCTTQSPLPPPPPHPTHPTTIDAGRSGVPAPPLHATAALAVFSALFNATAAEPGDGGGTGGPAAAVAFATAALPLLDGWHAFVSRAVAAPPAGSAVPAAGLWAIGTPHSAAAYPWPDATLDSAVDAALAAAPAGTVVDDASATITVPWLGEGDDLVTLPCLPDNGGPASLPPWMTANASAAAVNVSRVVRGWCITACVIACAYDGACASATCPPLAYAPLEDNVALFQAMADLDTLHAWVANSQAQPPATYPTFDSLIAQRAGRDAAVRASCTLQLPRGSAGEVGGPLADPPSPSVASLLQLCTAAWCGGARITGDGVQLLPAITGLPATGLTLLAAPEPAPSGPNGGGSDVGAAIRAAKSAVAATALSSAVLSAPAVRSLWQSAISPAFQPAAVGYGALDVRLQAAVAAAASAPVNGGRYQVIADLLVGGWALAACAAVNASGTGAASASLPWAFDGASGGPLAGLSSAVDPASAAYLAWLLAPPTTPIPIPLAFQGAAYMLTVMAVELIVVLAVGSLCVVLGFRTIATLRRENAAIIAANKRAARGTDADEGDAPASAAAVSAVGGSGDGARAPLLSTGSGFAAALDSVLATASAATNGAVPAKLGPGALVVRLPPLRDAAGATLGGIADAVAVGGALAAGARGPVGSINGPPITPAGFAPGAAAMPVGPYGATPTMPSVRLASGGSAASSSSSAGGGGGGGGGGAAGAASFSTSRVGALGIDVASPAGVGDDGETPTTGRGVASAALSLVGSVVMAPLTAWSWLMGAHGAGDGGSEADDNDDDDAERGGGGTGRDAGDGSASGRARASDAERLSMLREGGRGVVAGGAVVRLTTAIGPPVPR
jgi:hypothetical protein